ncbi:MAG: hypothetical protein A2Z32_00835 [Chloroflexi bacterium RBG_16_69_14]|nr:MAG: hypothetical protein A2Z32_00835 [Chloroflexi bacterium RBG_16_69_14]
MTDHERFRLLAAAAIDGTLTPAEMRDLGAHLAACPVCRAEERALRMDNQLLVSALTPVPVGPGVRAVVVRTAKGRRQRNGWPLLAAAALLILAAVAAALLAGGARLLQSSEPTPPIVRPVAFAPAVTYRAGEGPGSIDSGDLDADGDLDLVVANAGGSGAVSVLLGDGAGRFGGIASYSAIVPESVRIGDIDLDGTPDLVLALPRGDAVVMTGVGRGIFGDPVLHPAGLRSREAVIAAIDDDRWPDLAVVNDSSVSILLGAGDGGFGTATDHLLSGGPALIAAADFDQDGHLDLAVGTKVSREIVLLWGDGQGGFSRPQAFSDSYDPTGLTAGDVDRDGDVDLVVSNSGPGTVSVLTFNPAGPFFAPVSLPVPHPTEDGPGPIAIEDLDLDGWPDLVVGFGVHAEIGIFMGDGRGGFLAPVTFPSGGGPVSLVVRDFDGDGLRDVITANANDGTVSVHLRR